VTAAAYTGSRPGENPAKSRCRIDRATSKQPQNQKFKPAKIFDVERELSHEISVERKAGLMPCWFAVRLAIR
jgi:hypothetical protein